MIISGFVASLVAVITFIPAVATAREDFVQPDGKWKYSNGDVKPPENWKDVDFDDSQWLSGEAPLGYGNYQLRTKVRSEKSPRPIVSYFRTSFVVDDPNQWEKLRLKYKADDGAVVYLNGQWISSFNMPGGEIDDTTTATKTIRGWVPYKEEDLPSGALMHLVKGKNTISISAHQVNPTSSDLNLAFTLTGIEKGIQTKELMNLDSSWKYSDQRQLPDNDWALLDFDDSGWKSGTGVFGYGNPDVTTVLDFGNDPSNKPICSWFRREFTIDDDMDVRALRFKVRFDDATMVFLNGKEIMRHNLPFGYSDHQTPGGEEFNDWSNKHKHRYDLPAREVRTGRNVLAIQIHGSGPRSPDICFAMNSFSVEYLPRDAKASPVLKPTPTPERGQERVVVKVTSAPAVAEASPSDWLYSSQKYLDIALSSYEKEKLDPARRAYCAAKWAELFAGEASGLKPEIKLFLLAPENLAVAQEYLDLYSTYDDHDRIYEILNSLFESSKESFSSHANLAMAIALVYDQEPPRSWPHHQVGGTILPRRLPDPVEAFSFWVTSDTTGKTLHPLKSLGIGELKYVVDSPATLEQLAEAQDLRVRLSNLKELYPGIEYSHDRLERRIYDWPFQEYTLEKIKKEGGICVDQAYYTAQVAKAFGVPSMMVSGSGSNGNHAWVGFLDQRERWDFETGRYEEAKFVTGETFDPQTWQQPTDHDITLLTERFQSSPRYQVSRVHTIFAREYLKGGKITEAMKASELAIKSESRNFEAWDLFVQAKKKSETKSEDLRKIYEAGAKTFSRIADLEAHFLKRLATSLNQDGQTAEAEKVRDRIISRNRRERPDLALEESKTELDRLIQDAPVSEQLTFYKQQIQKLKDAGLITYYSLTRPFLEHLLDDGEEALALEALDYTERKMEVREGSQLEEELHIWKGKLGGK
ncbi:hypothetical protein V2O64_06265 [Verrucomicrobiaceae bacterium 227]